MPDEVEKALDVVSKAWGRGASGYCFFPVIRGDAADKAQRIQSYSEGPAYQWPEDRAKILDHLRANQNNDVYWCPNLFDSRSREWENALHERCLWADLDEVDPRQIKDYPPTIAWRTSPGRYQAIWILAKGYIQGASWPGNENHRLTVHLGADAGGWDTTQLLRLPGWENHKLEYRGKRVKGELLWTDGRRYFVDDFQELPEVPAPEMQGLEGVIEDEIKSIDRHQVWARVQLKVTQRCRDLYSARAAAGDRSGHLWYLTRCLADAGCTVAEIVALVKETVWNKFDGRTDEIRRLVAEAAKAIAKRSTETEQKVREDRGERPKPELLTAMLKNIPPPQWLVKGVLTKGACAFIAGQPKSFKSWFALDLAFSLAEGMPFLDHFRVMQPGPVLYIQEEDSTHLLKARADKILASKRAWRIELTSDGLYALPPHQSAGDPEVYGVVSSGIEISDPSWQAWLDECISQRPYVAVILDPLMMMAGEVKESIAQEMTTKIFKPLKLLARKHECAIVVVHHMRKTNDVNESRGGQLMLGSVANHAWSEDALYVRLGKKGALKVEVESKAAPVKSFIVKDARRAGWFPVVQMDDSDDSQVESSDRSTRRASGTTRRASSEIVKNDGSIDDESSPRAMILDALRARGGMTSNQVAAELKISLAKARVLMRELALDGLVLGEGTGKTYYGKDVMRWTVMT